jgi:hypothetical protein
VVQGATNGDKRLKWYSGQTRTSKSETYRTARNGTLSFEAEGNAGIGNTVNFPSGAKPGADGRWAGSGRRNDGVYPTHYW